MNNPQTEKNNPKYSNIMKKTLTIVALGAAFLAVSLWVWLSRGKSAKAVRAKFRLGGALLTLSGMMALGSCTPLTCYDPLPANEVWWDSSEYQVEQGGVEVRNGDQLTIQTAYMTVDQIVVTLNDANGMEMQRELFQVEQTAATSEFLFIVDVDDYVGEAELVISLRSTDGSEKPIYARSLNVVE